MIRQKQLAGLGIKSQMPTFKINNVTTGTKPNVSINENSTSEEILLDFVLASGGQSSSQSSASNTSYNPIITIYEPGQYAEELTFSNSDSTVEVVSGSVVDEKYRFMLSAPVGINAGSIQDIQADFGGSVEGVI